MWFNGRNGTQKQMFFTSVNKLLEHYALLWFLNVIRERCVGRPWQQTGKISQTHTQMTPEYVTVTIRSRFYNSTDPGCLAV